MVGRNGTDDIVRAAIIVAFVLLLIECFVPTGVLSVVSFALIAYAIYRSCSQNVAARRRENERFLEMTAKPRKRISLLGKKWRNRKTTSYFACRQCGATLSVPKGKGKIRVTCPKCGAQEIKNS